MKYFIYLISIFYFAELYQLFAFGSTGVTFCDLITLGMFVFFIKETIWDGKEIILAKNPAIFFVLWLFSATLLSGFAPLIRGEYPEMVQFLKSNAHFHFTALLLTINLLKNSKNEVWENFIRIWLIFSIFVNLFGAYQIVARALNLPFAWLEMNNLAFTSRGQYESVEDVPQISLRFEGFFRATSIFSEPTTLGAFNGLIIVFMLIPYIQKQKLFFKKNWLNILIFVWSAIGLLLAFSLTGLVCFALTILTIFIFEKFKNLKVFVKVLIILIVIFIIADQIVYAYSGISVIGLFVKRVGGIFGWLMTSQMKGTEGDSFISRTDNINAMLDIFLNNPLTGTGFGLTYYSPFSDSWHFADITLMAVLAELGIVGFAGFVGLTVILYIISIKFLIKRHQFQNLPDSYKKLLMMNTYLMNIYFVVNYISGNQIVNIFSYIILAIVFSSINNYYIEYKKSFYTIRLIKYPLKKLFYSSIKSQLYH